MNRKNLILGGILAVLVAAAYFYQGPWSEWRDGRKAPVNFLAGLETSRINKVEIAKAGAMTVLEKSGDRWRIGGTKDFYAAANEVESLLSDLKTAQTALWDLVSENKDRKIEFGTDRESGAVIRLFINGAEAVDLVVGQFGNDFSSSYISRPAMDETYLVKANLAGHFFKDDWRDKTIFSGDKNAITEVRFQYPNREFSAEKKGDVWEGVKPNKFLVANEKMEEILAVMTGLTAVKIPEQNFAGAGLENSKIIVEAAGEGVDGTIMIGNESQEDKDLFFAKRADSDNIYLISKDDKDKLDKKASDLK